MIVAVLAWTAAAVALWLILAWQRRELRRLRAEEDAEFAARAERTLDEACRRWDSHDDGDWRRYPTGGQG